MTRSIIPRDALDDRFGVLGTPGSGKTYFVLGAMARLLKAKARVVAIDPLGVMWGLRLKADGKTPSGHNVVIFGGKHADLPLTENAGTLIGETAATMTESCIVDLSDLPTKAAERRFMVAFLESIYRTTNPDKVEPYHLIVDEADRFAPQKPPKGDEILLNRLEEIVRRGRVRGFITWLVTQRSAVLNKNVLSMVDSLVVLKLVSATDRDQMRDWVDTHANPDEWRTLRAQFPTLQRGHGVLWMPSHGVLETVAFPENETFDSSASPKRGQRRIARRLKPLDLGALRQKLASIEAETKANDPTALKAENARLTRELAKVQRQAPPDLQAWAAGYAKAVNDITPFVESLNKATTDMITSANAVGRMRTHLQKQLKKRPKTTTHQPVTQAKISPPRQHPPGNGALNNSQYRVLGALAWWKHMGQDAPSRAQVTAIIGWKIASGFTQNIVGSLRTKGLIHYPKPNRIALTPQGAELAPEPDTGKTLHDGIRAALTGPQQKIFDHLVEAGRALPREELAQACGWSTTSGFTQNIVGSMRTMEIIDYPERGTVALQDWVVA